MASQSRYNLRVRVNDKSSENDEKSSTDGSKQQLKKPKKPLKKIAKMDMASVPPIPVGEHLPSDIPKSQPTSSVIPKKTKETKTTKPKKPTKPNHAHSSSESSSSVVLNDDNGNEVKILNAAEKAALEKVAPRTNAKGKKKGNKNVEKRGENRLEEASKNDRKRGSTDEMNGEGSEPEDKKPTRNLRVRKP